MARITSDAVPLAHIVVAYVALIAVTIVASFAVLHAFGYINLAWNLNHGEEGEEEIPLIDAEEQMSEEEIQEVCTPQSLDELSISLNVIESEIKSTRNEFSGSEAVVNSLLREIDEVRISSNAWTNIDEAPMSTAPPSPLLGFQHENLPSEQMERRTMWNSFSPSPFSLQSVATQSPLVPRTAFGIAPQREAYPGFPGSSFNEAANAPINLDQPLRPHECDLRRSVFVKGLPNVPELRKRLKRLFSYYGFVPTKVSLPQSVRRFRDFGFVEFESREVADQAIQEMMNCMLAGKRVVLSVPDSARNQS